MFTPIAGFADEHIGSWGGAVSSRGVKFIMSAFGSIADFCH